MEILNAKHFPLHGRLLIEASAGTGKTYTITSLYLRLLLGRDSALPRPLRTNEILVLTFTIAATDELRDRIRNRVSLARQIFSGEPVDAEDSFIDDLKATSFDIRSDRRLLTAALQSLDEAAIFTIHGFCARVLNEQSFDTGTLFNLNLDGDKDLMLQNAAEDAFRQILMPLPEALRSLAPKNFKTPQAIAKEMKPFLFRHNLRYVPEAIDVEDDLYALFADDQRCKALWLAQDITALMREANFNGNKAAASRLKPGKANFIEDYCHSAQFDPTLWQPWTTEALENSKKAGTRMPQHEILQLIDSIYERRELITHYQIGLYHAVANNIKANLVKTKAQIGQLTLDDLLVEVHRALQNDSLASNLAQLWPVAMIDEFQDTDDLQFEIFSKIYKDLNSSGPSALLYIGDPKQAIYNFRGADVYTYINAKQTADQNFSLATNWRSTPNMVKAVNHLFDKAHVFGNDEDIAFEPVSAANNNIDKQFSVQGEALVPLTLFIDPEETKGQYIPHLMGHAAEETSRLLGLAAADQALINGKPLQPGQIAFLVRSGKDARAARQALAARNIRSVYVTLESVLLTETADDLMRILEAVIEPTNESALKAALGTRLMQISASEIYELNQNWSKLHEVMQEFQHYHHLWATLEVAPMIERLMANRQIAEKWLLHPDGERQITNLRHLAELLQTRSLAAPGMRRLLKWYQREKLSADTVASDERQLRLESDSNLVQIVTMHASKGLEYDVVMIPYGGFGEPRNKEQVSLFHLKDEHGAFHPAIDFSGNPEHQIAAQEESFSEDIRLMYVAMTRARYCCYLGFPLSKKILQTPIARLLNLTSREVADVQEKLGQLPNELFKLQTLHTDCVTPYQPQRLDKALAPALNLPSTRTNWRMHSYTGLTRLLTQLDAPITNIQPRPGYGDDEVGADIDPKSAFSRFSFPRGAKVGIVLHEFMENLDFNADAATVHSQAQRCLAKMGQVDDMIEWQKVLVEWFGDIVRTPMAEHSFCLSDIPAAQRLDEMEFHFPIDAGEALIQDLKSAGVLGAHMDLRSNTLQGMMTGYIDLIVAFEDKYYLIDYKSNDLGGLQSSYSPEAVAHEVKHHHYDLQYLIYCVALNRYLQQRISGYDYEEHFGGVHYLFLRGMDGNTGSGVFADRPAKSLIERLDKLLTRSGLVESATHE